MSIYSRFREPTYALNHKIYTTAVKTKEPCSMHEVICEIDKEGYIIISLNRKTKKKGKDVITKTSFVKLNPSNAITLSNEIHILVRSLYIKRMENEIEISKQDGEFYRSNGKHGVLKNSITDSELENCDGIE